MADLKTSMIVRAVDKFTAPIKKMAAVNGQLADSMQNGVGPARRLTERQRDLGRLVGQTTSRVKASTAALSRWGKTASAVSAAGGQFLAKGLRLGAGAGALGYGLKRAFINPAAQFERFETVLKTIEGSSEKARESMNWIDDFAVKTPFELAQVTDAFVKLRAYGLNPTDGLLRDLGDASAAMGKPLMQAVEAIADAVTGENERLKEFGVKARAVEGGKVRYEYEVGGETKIAEAMAADGAQIRQVLGGILDIKYRMRPAAAHPSSAKKFGGAMAQESKTFMGMLGNLTDQWARFRNLVMASGLFDFLKGRLGEALSWAADKLGGRLASELRRMAMV